MRFQTIDQDVVLKMWEKTMMPESNMGEKDGKKVFVKTGNMIEMTTYTFIDGFGEKLVFLSKNNNFRDLEGSKVEIVIGIEYNDFKKQNRIVLESLSKSKK